MNSEVAIEKLIELTVTYGPKLVAAILVLIVGMWLVKLGTKAIERIMDKRQIDPSLKPFFTGMLNALLKVLLVVSVLGMLGVEMTSFIAILGSIGLAVGLALSGTLQNFAGGVMLLIFKPFKVGDLIEAQGYLGVVSEIQIVATILKTLDNKTVVIPNGGLSTGSLVNYTTEPLRRCDWTFGIAYGDDADKARSVITRLANEDNRILKELALYVAIEALADSSVNFTVRAWVKNEDYWDVNHAMNEKVYKAFAVEGLNIPFPQMDVHVHGNK